MGRGGQGRLRGRGAVPAGVGVLAGGRRLAEVVDAGVVGVVVVVLHVGQGEALTSALLPQLLVLGLDPAAGPAGGGITQECVCV